MNSSEYIDILKNPEKINTSIALQLEEIIQEFPYFQSARSLQLKELNKTNNYKYNANLKKTAAYTIDRKVLFELITSPTFIHKKVETPEHFEDLEIIDAETVKGLHKKITDSISIENSDVKKDAIKEITQKASEILGIGKPIPFNSAEPHSFNEWMQLISQEPINREEETKSNHLKPTQTEEKFNLIDRFIESNPKLKPIDKNAETIDLTAESSTENDSLMTETLAKVYLEQKKYENAIKAYHILSLKYPEKSGFFADRIKAIKILQRN